MENAYVDEERIRAKVAAGEHRHEVGGLWEEVGRLQFEYLVQAGLKPSHRLIDVGCGALRGGVHFVRYLEPGCYFGADRSQALLDAGYEQELGELQAKLPRANLLCTAEFELDRFGTTFDMAVAQSLFTHLTFNSIRLCLLRLARVMPAGAPLWATFWLCPDGERWDVERRVAPGGKISRPAHDPYHYRVSDFVTAGDGMWDVRLIGDWGHPRGQQMLQLTRR